MRFLMVDEIVDMVPGRSIHAVKTLAPDDELFRDHFPGFPVVPGVLLVEMMAQAAGKCLDAVDPSRGKAMLAHVRNGSFRQWVRPGDRADIHGEVTASAPAYAAALCRIVVNGQDVADANLLFAFVPWSQLAPDFRDDALERYLRQKAVGGDGR